MLLDPKNSRELVLGIGLSFQLVAAVVLGLYLGMEVEKRYEIQPFGSLVGAIFGFIAGIISFVKLYKKPEN